MEEVGKAMPLLRCLMLLWWFKFHMSHRKDAAVYSSRRYPFVLLLFGPCFLWKLCPCHFRRLTPSDLIIVLLFSGGFFICTLQLWIPLIAHEAAIPPFYFCVYFKYPLWLSRLLCGGSISLHCSSHGHLSCAKPCAEWEPQWNIHTAVCRLTRGRESVYISTKPS